VGLTLLDVSGVCAPLTAPGADAELLRLGQEHDAAFKRASDLNKRVFTLGAAELAASDDDEVDGIRHPSDPGKDVGRCSSESPHYGRVRASGHPRLTLLDDILAGLIDDILLIAGAEPRRHTSPYAEEG
jgi:hypothetical protein